MSDPPPIQRAPTEAYYASRTLQALELLTFNDLSCPQLAAALEIHPRTARRMLVRLAADGYIEQTFDSRRRYRATLRLAALGCQVIAHAELPRIAAPYVAKLPTTTAAAAHLMIPSYRGVACVLHCDDPCPQRIAQPMLRELLPAHATGAGKVLLAFRQPWRDSVLAGGGLPLFTERTITAPGDIERAATEIRTRGYAIDDGEYRPGTLGVAAPVFVGHDVPAALALTRRRDSVADVVDAVVERVVAAAAALTLALKRPEAGCGGRPA
jgi:IclR family acetate operon transcriptional repressor